MKKKPRQAAGNELGMGLIEVMMASVILVIVMLGLVTFLNNQVRETRGVTQKLSALDLEKTLIATLADGGVCRFVMTDASQSGNRSTDLIDSTNLSAATITLQNIPASSVVGGPLVAETGHVVSAIDPTMTIQSIVLKGFVGGPDQFNGIAEITFDPANLVRNLKPLAVRVILLTNPASPANAKQVTGCLGVAGGGGGGGSGGPSTFRRITGGETSDNNDASCDSPAASIGVGGSPAWLMANCPAPACPAGFTDFGQSIEQAYGTTGPVVGNWNNGYNIVRTCFGPGLVVQLKTGGKLVRNAGPLAASCDAGASVNLGGSPSWLLANCVPLACPAGYTDNGISIERVYGTTGPAVGSSTTGFNIVRTCVKP